MDALEKAVRGLMRAAREALVAQDRHHYWAQFATNSKRARAAEARWEKAQARLDRAEVNAEEALQPYRR